MNMKKRNIIKDLFKNKNKINKGNCSFYVNKLK